MVAACDRALLGTSDTLRNNQVETKLTGLDLFLVVVVNTGCRQCIAVAAIGFLILARSHVDRVQSSAALTWTSSSVTVSQFRVASGCVLFLGNSLVSAVGHGQLWGVAASLVGHWVRTVSSYNAKRGQVRLCLRCCGRIWTVLASRPTTRLKTKWDWLSFFSLTVAWLLVLTGYLGVLSGGFLRSQDSDFVPLVCRCWNLDRKWSKSIRETILEQGDYCSLRQLKRLDLPWFGSCWDYRQSDWYS